MPYKEGLVHKIIAILSKPETRIAWFRWLEWATISAAVYGLGRHAAARAAASTGILAAGWGLGAILLLAAAIVSETILVWQAYSAIERFVVTLAGGLSPRSHPIAARLVVLALGLLPLGITFFLMAAFHAALE